MLRTMLKELKRYMTSKDYGIVFGLCSIGAIGVSGRHGAKKGLLYLFISSVGIPVVSYILGYTVMSLYLNYKGRGVSEEGWEQ